MLGDHEYIGLWTPGHTHDHYSFYCNQTKILFAGDLILKKAHPMISGFEESENALKTYFTSLKKINNLNVKYVLPGHNEKIKDLEKRIREIKAHYEKRLNQTFESIKPQGMTTFKLTKQIYDEDISSERFKTRYYQISSNSRYLESLKTVKMIKHNSVMYNYQITDELQLDL